MYTSTTMERRSRLYPYLLGVGLVLAIALTIGFLMDRSRKLPDDIVAMSGAVQCLKAAGISEKERLTTVQ